MGAGRGDDADVVEEEERGIFDETVQLPTSLLVAAERPRNTVCLLGMDTCCR